VVALYYQAADLYIHATRADTFPNSIIEALACGTPVVATAVGGIPEQVKGLANSLLWPAAIASSYASQAGQATGMLVPLADAEAMAKSIEFLLMNPELCRLLSENAVKDTHRRFALGRQAEEYLEWFSEILQRQVTNIETSPIIQKESSTRMNGSVL
jgi:glycosyltransferase involved in cell wall biosynthesis